MSGIDRDRRVAFFEREQFPRVRDDVGIRDAVRAHAGDLRIGVARIAGCREQRATRGALERELARPHPTVPIGDAAGIDRECMDHPVALQRVVAPARRELRIRADAVERPAQVRGNLAVDAQIGVVAFHAQRFEAAAQIRVVGGIGCGHAVSSRLRRRDPTSDGEQNAVLIPFSMHHVVHAMLGIENLETRVERCCTASFRRDENPRVDRGPRRSGAQSGARSIRCSRSAVVWASSSSCRCMSRAAGLRDCIAALRHVRNFAGAIVSMPHKTAMTALVDELTDDARLVGAVNVIARRADGRLTGALLDGVGFVDGLIGRGTSRVRRDVCAGRRRRRRVGSRIRAGRCGCASICYQQPHPTKAQSRWRRGSSARFPRSS